MSDKREDYSDNKLVFPYKHLRFAINQHLYEKIENKIKTVKKTRKGYTKHQWFVEAVSEKLDQDERRTKKHLLKNLSSSKHDY